METDILIYPIEFEHIAAPGRDVEGDVVDAATGQPVPGVVIRPKMIHYGAFENPYPSSSDGGRTGRYESRRTRAGITVWDGLPVGHPVELGTMLSDRTPYRPMSQEVPNAPGIGPTRLDFKLVRGIPVEGKVTNRTTGKPVAAFVEYLPTLENPNLSSIQDVSLFEPIATRPDGSFTLPTLPGPGVVVASVMDDRFLTADRARADQPAQARKLGIIRGVTSPERCQALEPITPESTAKTYRCDLSIVPAPEPIVRILDPDGQPLAGAIVSGTLSLDLSRECWWQSRQHGVFRVTGLIHHRIRNLAIHHQGRRLAGTLAVRDAEPGPLVARLRPWGTVSGRLVDRDGQPRPWRGPVLSRFLPRLEALRAGLSEGRDDRLERAFHLCRSGARSGLRHQGRASGRVCTDRLRELATRRRTRRNQGTRRRKGGHSMRNAAHRSDPWAPYSATASDPWDLRRVVHLHRRAGFGATWLELERDLADGPQAAIDRILTGRSRASGVPDDFDHISGLIADDAVQSGGLDRLQAWWVYRLLFSPDPLGERLTLLWHNHFATSNEKVQDLRVMRRQNETHRRLGRRGSASYWPRRFASPRCSFTWMRPPTARAAPTKTSPES